MHPDHVFGNAAFGARSPNSSATPSWRAPGRACRALSRHQRGAARRRVCRHPHRPPDRTGQRPPRSRSRRAQVLIEAHPTAHTDNDLTVSTTRRERCSSATCCSPARPGPRWSIRGWLALIDKLEARDDAKLAVPGQGRRGEHGRGDRSREAVPQKISADVRAHDKAGKRLPRPPRPSACPKRRRGSCSTSITPAMLQPRSPNSSGSDAAPAACPEDAMTERTTRSSRSVLIAGRRGSITRPAGHAGRGQRRSWPGLHQRRVRTPPIIEEDGLVTLEAPIPRRGCRRWFR